LKAYLIFHQKRFRKTHNIAELIELCKEITNDFDKLYELKIENLTPYATEIRYGEDFYYPSEEDAKNAMLLTEKVRDFVRTKLNSESMDL